jgi:hypothetical protein
VITRRAAAAFLGVAVVAGSACKSAPKPPQPAAVVASADAELIRTLAVLATSRMPSPADVDAVKREITAGRTTYSGYIERLLENESLATEVVPLVILRQFLGQDAMGAPGGFPLSKTDGPDPIYYLYDPCKPADAVEVKPWWSLAEGKTDTIKVCRDSYVPDRWNVDRPKGEAEAACLSGLGPGPEGKRCGCGPNLLRCFESDAQATAFRGSIRAEIRRTVEYNVRQNRPLSEIFTSNETFRDRNAEALRWTLTAEARHEPIPDHVFQELAAWPADGRWAAREDLAPGQNAGVLTAPQIIQYTLDRRQRMTAISDVLWCIDPDSVGASPESALSVAAKSGANLQLSSDGWKDLAARPVCTNCHARLDYGFQFFWGFPNSYTSMFFTPALQKKERGPLYFRDIDDPRGETDLTPKGFAQLATAQPEFNRCMARNFAEYALGNRVTKEQVDALEAKVKPTTPARDVMRAALALVVETWGPGAAIARTPSIKASKTTVSITPELRTLIENKCLDCHDHEEGRPDLSGTQLGRLEVVDVLEAVASGRMPKDAVLHGAERSAFLGAFIDSMWSDEDARAAQSYFVDRFVALPAYPPEVAFELIHRAAKSKMPGSVSGWRMIENGVRPDVQQMTAGFITVTALQAIEACRDAGTREARDRCIADALKLQNLGRDPAARPGQ